MKYVLLLAGVAIIYFILCRAVPVAQVKDAVTASEVAPLTTGGRDAKPAATALKRPFDRTNAVLDQAKQRTGDGEF